MHIVIDARIINSSTGRYVERLLHYLQAIDAANTYTVLVPPKDETFWQPTAPNFQVRVADFANYSFEEQLGFKRFLDNLKPDLVHFCMPQQPVLYQGKTVTTFHDLTLLNTYNSDKNWFVYHFKQSIGRILFKHVARKSTAIITPTQYTKEALVAFAGINDKKVTVTYEAAEPPMKELKEYRAPYDRYVIYIGQQPDYKNIRRLGDAHQKLLEHDPDLGLILVGKRTEAVRANEAYFVSRGYKNIHFTDFIPDDQRDWLLSHAEAYAFPSLMEGFGLPGLEAMAAGTPVISSNATCLPEVYGDAAQYFDPYNTDAMAAAINAVISDEKLRAKLIASGTEQVKKYSWRRMAEQTHEVYVRALR
jgi:glycosyltransferase involved in cell wall biosynthesis